MNLLDEVRRNYPDLVAQRYSWTPRRWLCRPTS